jgi:DNA-binding MarR family transcriptional regulator
LAKAARSKLNESPRKMTAVDYGDLANSVGFLLRRAQLATFAELIETLAPLKLRPAQFSVLVLIGANPDVAQSDLSAALGIQRPNFVALLDELEARGLTRRCVSASDRRSNQLALTAEGRRVLKRALELHSAYENSIARRMGTNGREEIARVLSKLADLNPVA